MPIIHGSLLERLHARDRALFARLLLAPCVPTRGRTQLVAITHLGGAHATIALALLPFCFGPRWLALGRLTVASLALSHLAVQLVKRSVGRPRPSTRTRSAAWIQEPDRFSFPSGHAASAMALAVAYAIAAPLLTVPLVALATLVGVSRVCLGVHYPGDVLAGQCLAIATVALLRVAGL
jgi:undecaprenyl-diphosphatase